MAFYGRTLHRANRVAIWNRGIEYSSCRRDLRCSSTADGTRDRGLMAIDRPWMCIEDRPSGLNIFRAFLPPASAGTARWHVCGRARQQDTRLLRLLVRRGPRNERVRQSAGIWIRCKWMCSFSRYRRTGLSEMRDLRFHSAC